MAPTRIHTAQETVFSNSFAALTPMSAIGRIEMGIQAVVPLDSGATVVILTTHLRTIQPLYGSRRPLAPVPPQRLMLLPRLLGTAASSVLL